MNTRWLTPVKNRPVRLIMFVVSVAVACATVFSAYGGMMDPMRSCIGAVAAMVFPGMLALSLFLLAVELIWFRWSAALTLMSLVVCAGPIDAFCPINIMRPSVEKIRESRTKVLKVMTYNVANFDDFSRSNQGVPPSDAVNPTLACILRENPDICVIQEGRWLDTAKVSQRNMDQLSETARKYPYRYINQRGMGLISRYPFVVNRLEHADQWGYDVYRYDVTVPKSGIIHVFNLHLQSLGLTPDDKVLYRRLTKGDSEVGFNTVKTRLYGKLAAAFRERARQARFVRDAVNDTEGPVMVCGDFNDIQGCYAQRVIMGGNMTDAYRSSGMGAAISFHTDRFFFRIDHILCNRQLRPLRTWYGDNPSSDHYPLLSYIEIVK